MNPKLLKTLALIVLIGLAAAAVSARAHTGDVSEPLAASQNGDVTLTVEQIDVPQQTAPATKPPRLDVSLLRPATAEVVDLAEPGVFIVQLWDPPLALYAGGVPGIAATHPATRGETKLDVKSPASVAYMVYLERQQAQAIAEVSEALDRRVDVLYQYKASLNGFAVELTAAEAATVAGLEGIKHIEPEREYVLHTDAGPAWMGAPDIWDGSATGGLPGTMGEGIVVGVIDTGIDPWNPSFADVGGDGYDHTNPKGAGNYVGVCDTTDSLYDPSFPCNDKLIGARGYLSVNGGDPRDTNGHGSHTSSTAAGNFVYGTVITVTDGTTFTADISGVAPHTNIIMYAVCGSSGCSGAALAAARDDALLDGVDVINYSIGASAPTLDPWQDAEAVQWLAIREAGVYVATSAGNAGPGDATLFSPSDLPWLTTVGANSHNRTFLNTLVMTNANPLSPTLTIVGQSMTGPLLTPAPVVLSSDFANPPTISEEDARLCAPGTFPAGTFSGEVVVCERGEYARVAKGQAVKDGGAGGYVLAQPEEFGGGPGALTADPHVLPALHIDWYEYQKLKAYLASAAVVSGTITGSVLDVDPSNGDIMASFSARGPNQAIPDYVVPDVTAPGRAIWAAYAQGPGGDGDFTYNVIQGTSMSSPHVAGAFALIKALHPEWSPAEAQSALMTTARDTVLNDDGVNTATPFAQGAGHADLTKAARAGLVLDVTRAEYEAADPAVGGDAKTLNLPSLGDSECLGMCSWTRTVSSTLSYAVTWSASVTSPTTLTLTVDPSNFSLPAGGTQVLTVEADVSALPVDDWAFGTVTLTPSTAGDVPPAAHFPVAVRPVAGVLPDMVEINTRRNAGSQVVTGLQTLEITNLTVEVFGLTEGGFTTEVLSQDETRSDPYDNLNDGTTFYITETVPSAAKRLVAEITDAEAIDIDLFVGRDLDGNGPEQGEELCSSTTSSWPEYCEITDPVAGVYWILVQNWQESTSSPDEVTLVTAVVPGTDAGSLSVTGPTSVPASTPFDLRVFWDTPDMQAGDRWYGAFSLGSDTGKAGNIGTLPVDIIRHADDVVKTVSPDSAIHGETVTYTIAVYSNVAAEDLTYHITDTIPSGLSYVADSASTTSGVVNVVGNQVTWSGVRRLPGREYVATTSAADPACVNPFDGTATYADLETIFGWNTSSGLSGNLIAWSYPGFPTVEFYGEDKGDSPFFTDDGYAPFGRTFSPNHQNIPDSNNPNDLLAPFWFDFEVVYDAATNKGVTAGASSVFFVVEFDDLEPNPAGSTSSSLDFEVMMFSSADDSPGAYEIIFGYDNINGTLSSGTIGVENSDGSQATNVAYNNVSTVITDDLLICLDWAIPTGPVLITYQATVDADAEFGTYLINEAVHDTDNPGSKQATTDAALLIGYENGMYMPVVLKGR